MSPQQDRRHSLLVIRREAYIQLGLGGFALASGAVVAWWLLQQELHIVTWLGVSGVLALGAAFLGNGWRAREEYTWLEHPSPAATTARPTALDDRRGHRRPPPSLPEEPMAPAKPALELGFSDKPLERVGHTEREKRRRPMLWLMLVGIVASVLGPGVNILLSILTAGRADGISLAAWVLLTLPICLAVWTLPPRGLWPQPTDTHRHD